MNTRNTASYASYTYSNGFYSEIVDAMKIPDLHGILSYATDEVRNNVQDEKQRDIDNFSRNRQKYRPVTPKM